MASFAQLKEENEYLTNRLKEETEFYRKTADNMKQNFAEKEIGFLSTIGELSAEVEYKQKQNENLLTVLNTAQGKLEMYSDMIEDLMSSIGDIFLYMRARTSELIVKYGDLKAQIIVYVTSLIAFFTSLTAGYGTKALATKAGFALAGKIAFFGVVGIAFVFIAYSLYRIRKKKK